MGYKITLCLLAGEGFIDQNNPIGSTPWYDPIIDSSLLRLIQPEKLRKHRYRLNEIFHAKMIFFLLEYLILKHSSLPCSSAL